MVRRMWFLVFAVLLFSGAVALAQGGDDDQPPVTIEFAGIIGGIEDGMIIVDGYTFDAAPDLLPPDLTVGDVVIITGALTGEGDAVEITGISLAPDTDNDSIPDPFDNCPEIANADQLDTDEDGYGDACDDADDGLL